jgi:hypothetical protein
MPRQIWRRKPTEIEVEYFDHNVYPWPSYVEGSEINVCYDKETDRRYPCPCIIVDNRELSLPSPTFIQFRDGKPVGFINPEQLKRDYTIVHRKWANHAFDWHAGVDEEEMETAISGLGLKTPAN